MTMGFLGIGIDLVEVRELEAMIARRGERLLARIFTRRETIYCQAKHRPTMHFAARLAAKEAAFKALGTGWGRGVGWLDVEVVVEEPGSAPALSLTGAFLTHMTALGASASRVSLTHTTSYASAVVLLLPPAMT